MSEIHLLLLSQRVFYRIGEYYKAPSNELLSMNLALVTSLGIYIINDANRYEDEDRKILQNSAVAQTITAVISTAACTIFFKTFREQTIGLLASIALISVAGAYFKRPLKDNLIVTLLLSSSPYIMSVID